MDGAERRVGERYLLERREFPAFLAALSASGYRVVGPTLRDGAIVYGEIRTESDLPIGWTDRQEAGTYRVVPRGDGALFGYAVGPHSWKKYLFPSRERLWSARAKEGSAGGFEVEPEPAGADPPLAFLGVRVCELAAIAIQDRAFTMANDVAYLRRRERILRVAVQCGVAGGTCFCVSMGTGPAAAGGFDLALTELIAPEHHRFLIEVGSPAGAKVLTGVPLAAAPADSAREAEEVVARTARSMGRSMRVEGIRDLLVQNPEHPRWNDVARRCLACTNCTMACPTCFCQTSEEVPELAGGRVERWRRGDSCFTTGFSELHGTAIRKSHLGRYRQWMTHKLATWYDQFGSSGCVGCGRCITWCPVGIDLTVEVEAIRSSPGVRPSEPSPP